MATTKLARMVLDGAKNILGFKDGKGGLMNLVQSQVNPVTGVIRLSGGGVQVDGDLWAFLGDSITFGSGSSNAGVNAYPLIFKKLAGGLRVSPTSIGAGVAGETSAMIKLRVAALIAQGITHIAILAGANDANNGVSVAAFYANICEMMAACKNAGVKIYIGTVPARGSAASATIRKAVDSMSLAVRKAALIYGAVVFGVNQRLANSSTGYLNYDSGDGLHPNDRGHYEIAYALYDAWLKDASSTSILAGPSQIGHTANPCMTGAGPLPTGYLQNNSFTSGTAPVYSVVAGAAVGNYFQIAVNALAATVVVVNAPWLRNSVAGDALALTFKCEVQDVSGTWDAAVLAGTASAVVYCFDNVTLIGGVATSFARSIGPVYEKYTIPDVSASVKIWLTVPAGTNAIFKFSEVDLINETLAGVSL